jgi:hypothetical protein
LSSNNLAGIDIDSIVDVSEIPSVRGRTLAVRSAKLKQETRQQEQQRPAKKNKTTPAELASPPVLKALRQKGVTQPPRKVALAPPQKTSTPPAKSMSPVTATSTGGIGAPVRSTATTPGTTCFGNVDS